MMAVKKLKAKPALRRSRGPDPVDVFVGGKLQFFRSKEDMTQTDLATKLGVSFQQVQKYEGGINRISASRLYHLGRIFGIPIQSFFEGFDVDQTFRTQSSLIDKSLFSWLESQEGDLMERTETTELLKIYYQIKAPEVRRTFLQMLKSFVGS